MYIACLAGQKIELAGAHAARGVAALSLGSGLDEGCEPRAGP